MPSYGQPVWNFKLNFSKFIHFFKSLVKRVLFCFCLVTKTVLNAKVVKVSSICVPNRGVNSVPINRFQFTNLMN
jgi:hypothetical protein